MINRQFTTQRIHKSVKLTIQKIKQELYIRQHKK